MTVFYTYNALPTVNRNPPNWDLTITSLKVGTNEVLDSRPQNIVKIDPYYPMIYLP